MATNPFSAADIVRENYQGFDGKNRMRAAGQGAMLNWSDEAEALARSKMNGTPYESELKQIRQEYGKWAQENPLTAGATEFIGGAVPGALTIAIPGGKPAASTLGALGKMAAIGGVAGGIAGAGNAGEGQSRFESILPGTVIGAALGPAVAIGTRAVGGIGKMIRERFAPTEESTTRRAAEWLNQKLRQSDMTPQQMEQVVAADRAMGVPSTIANASPGTARLAEAVVQRSGKGAQDIEKEILGQKLGSKERVYGQVEKGLDPGEYFDDLARLKEDMATKSKPLYEKAYGYGEVSDPEVLKFLELPQFQKGLQEAEGLLAAEGRSLPKKIVKDPTTGAETEVFAPTVEVLDQVKRGLDSLIERETDAVTGKVSSLGRVYVQKKNEFLDALDKAVPEYGAARATYRGDAELSDAMRAGFSDFGKMKHEQVTKKLEGMSDAEKEAFRTGVARNLYAKIMEPSSGMNAAQKMIGSPEMQAKLQPLFDNPGQYNLFKAALERESQLFNHANNILGNSRTAQRQQMAKELEGDAVSENLSNALTGGWKGALLGTVLPALRKSQMSEKTANKLAEMLMSKDPSDVAAVVKLLEQEAAESVPRALRAGALEAGTATGITPSVLPAPLPESKPETVEDIIRKFEAENSHESNPLEDKYQKWLQEQKD